MDAPIRGLRPEDRAEWLRLRQALWDHITPAEHEREMNEILADLDQTPVFVAPRPGGGLCGFIELSIRSTAEGCTTGRIGYLEGWYVDQDWRRRGVGRRLVDRGEAWAREQGCTEMASDTTPDYPDSPPAHASLGYQEVARLICFCKDLV